MRTLNAAPLLEQDIEMQWKSSSTQVWLFLIAVSLACLLLGYQIGERLGLFLGLLMVVAILLFIFVFGESHFLKKLKPEALLGHDAWALNTRLGRISQQMGFQTPELFMISTPSAFAFSIGQPWLRGRIFISSGLLQHLSAEEVDSVLTHQVAQLLHMDSFRFGVASGFARLVLGISHFFDLLWLPNLLGRKPRQEPFLALLSPLAGLILRASINAKSYYKNDDFAAHMSSHKKVFATALWKLEGLSRTIPFALPPCTSHYFVTNPQSPLFRHRWWLESHPPIEKRIRRLIGTRTI